MLDVEQWAQIRRMKHVEGLSQRENVVLLGPPGTGKTHLAIAVSIRACLAGHRVAFASATEWVTTKSSCTT